MVRDCGEWIYFFIEIKREVKYAVTERDNDFWWVEAIESHISDQKGV